MASRKTKSKDSDKKEIQFAFVDHNGNLTDLPPDSSLKVEVDIEDSEINVPRI